MPAAGVTVRCATLEDIPALVVLMGAFYAESSYPLDNGWASEAFRKLLSNPALGCAWLASDGENSVGHAVLTARYTMEHGASSGYVDDLNVEPEYRRRGLGFALLETLFRECRARELASVYVEVGQSNRPALALTPSLASRRSRTGESCLAGRFARVASDPSIERASSGKLRLPAAAAHAQRLEPANDECASRAA